MQAPWVIAENDKPGTTAWRIVGKAPGTIAGFADQVSAAPGDHVVLYVTTNAPTFVVQAYRMGYYHGDGARLVWTSATMTGHVQPACPVTPGVNMVSCDNWAPSLHFTVGSAFVQGDYLLKLVGRGASRATSLSRCGPLEPRHLPGEERRVHVADLEPLRRLRHVHGIGRMPGRRLSAVLAGPGGVV